MRTNLNFPLTGIGDIESYSKLIRPFSSSLASQVDTAWLRMATESPAEKMAQDVLKCLNGCSIGADILSKVTGPMEALRARAALSESAIEKFNASANMSLTSSAARTFLEEHAKTLASFDAWDAAANQIGKTLFDRAGEFSRLAAVTKPFGGIDWTSAMSSRVSDNFKVFTRPPDWTRTLGLPAIDTAAVAAIGQIWGESGVERQLRSFGIDYDALMSGEVEIATERGELEASAQTGFAQLSFADVLSIVSIILAVLVPIWQKLDSDQMEARLAEKIQDEVAKQNERMAILEQLLEKALAVQQPYERGAVSFVVRLRVAHVRGSPKNGSQILAEVFPNQVVTLIREKGKWVEVEYFDWLAQESRQGWILKKYLLRVPSSSVKTPEITDRGVE